MAYVPVPKDLTRVKSKLVFNLTKRQIICFSLGALAGVPLFFLTKGALGTSVDSLLMIMAMITLFMFAMYFYATIEENIRSRREVKKILHGKAH